VQRDRLYSSSRPTDRGGEAEARKVLRCTRIGISVTGRITIAESEPETESNAEKIEKEKSQLGRGDTNAKGQKEEDADPRRDAVAKTEIEKEETDSCAGEDPEEIRHAKTI
jgi:hypothetical protein